jgi:hypothetical protein
MTGDVKNREAIRNEASVLIVILDITLINVPLTIKPYPIQ